MKNIDDLIESAAELTASGQSKGEIADELNVSKRTASWLVSRSQEANGNSPTATDTSDIHVDWSTIGKSHTSLFHVGKAMAGVLEETTDDVTVTVGIEKAGVPLATNVAQQLETSLAAYAPAKHQWNDEGGDATAGAFSRNFGSIADEPCVIVDDTITSGTTMRETVEAIRNEGGNPVAGIVLVDKEGVDEIEGVPVYSLVEVIPVGER
ncbi:transcriptional regulator GfcR [Haladaptatus sp. CMSO5]|uniref:transcriptional regulator GfcR n=1 Tax=Haladaptatus sp. CMSO5 TaxID=3120514 RepID=UPI002FCE2C0E